MALGSLLTIPAVIDYIFEANFDAAVAEIIQKFSLPRERFEEFLELTNAVLDNVVTVRDLPLLIAEAFGVDETVAKAITVDLVGKTLLPLAAYLPGLENDIVQLGGNLADYPPLRISKAPRQSSAILKETIGNLGVELTEVLSKRLLFLLGQYAKGEKTEESLKTYFTRSLNIGGLGLTEEQATSLLAVAVPQAKNLLEQMQPEVVKPPAVVVAKPVAEPAAVAAPKQELEIAPSHELAAEVPMTAAPRPDIKAPVGMPVATKVQPIIAKPKADADIAPNEPCVTVEYK